MRRRAWMILVFAVCALLGCGDDDSSNPADGDGGPDGSAGQHSGNSGHNGSGSGTGGDGNGTTGTGSGGTGVVNGAGGAGMAPAPVPCGSMMCTSSAQAAGLIDACCADATTSTCGTSMFGGSCTTPAPSDPRCPALDLMGLFSVPSCCAADGQCGIDGSQFGMGCMSLADAAQGGMGMMAGFPIAFPAPRACDGEQSDAGSDEDAGT